MIGRKREMLLFSKDILGPCTGALKNELADSNILSGCGSFEQPFL